MSGYYNYPFQPRSMPTKRSQLCTESYDSNIYAFGGMTNFHLNTNITEMYIPEYDIWQQGLPPMPRKISHMASARHLGRIYSIGGLVPGLVDGFWGMPFNFALDPREGYWVKLENMPTGRGALIAEQIDGIIYAIGGKNSNFVLTNNEAYETRMNKWMIKEPLPQATSSASSGVTNGQIHVMGGRLFSLISNTSLNQRYDPRTNMWSFESQLPYKVSNHAGLTFNGNIYIFGGENGYQTFNFTSKYDSITNTWRKICPMPSSLHGFSTSACMDNIYLFGGGSSVGFSISNSLIKYTPK